jgi:predicted NBD/HSP70 family sugar kinase
MLADVTQRVIAEQRLPLPPEHRADSGLDRAALLIEEMVESVGAGMGEVLAVGVGLPAPVDTLAGTVSGTGVLRGWDGVVVPEALGGRLGVPVGVDNDANLGALAEVRLGAARGLRNVVYVRASHGLGMGVVVDGQVLHGRRGMAGELGHVVADPGGIPCRCGNAGCLETTAGAAAVLAGLHPAHGHLALRDVVARAQDGDPDLEAALGDAGRRLGDALGMVCTLLDPEMVVIGGELAHAGEILLAPLREVLHARAMHGDAGPVPVHPAVLGDQAEVRGALALAVEVCRVVVASGGAS